MLPTSDWRFIHNTQDKALSMFIRKLLVQKNLPWSGSNGSSLNSCRDPGGNLGVSILFVDLENVHAQILGLCFSWVRVMVRVRIIDFVVYSWWEGATDRLSDNLSTAFSVVMVLMAPSASDLQRSLDWLAADCEAVWMRINTRCCVALAAPQHYYIYL